MKVISLIASSETDFSAQASSYEPRITECRDKDQLSLLATEVARNCRLAPCQYTMREITNKDTPTREDIENLQAEMSSMPQVELVTNHYFATGVYVREMHVKAGTALVGKVHKTQHVFMLVSGDMTLISDQGRQRIQGPWICVSEPGIKRAGYAHEDCICLNIHHSFLTDMETLENELTEFDPKSMFGPGNTLKAIT